MSDVSSSSGMGQLLSYQYKCLIYIVTINDWKLFIEKKANISTPQSKKKTRKILGEANGEEGE